MIGLLIFLSIAAAAPQSERLAEAAHAITAGRLEQARAMIASAVAAGAEGEHVERLVADLAFASGKSSEALARYENLLQHHPDDLLLQERAAISALKAGDVPKSVILAERATRSSNASWRAWNARGVMSDLRNDWTSADAAYARALGLAPDQPEILNNQGWSRLLRGDWAGALGPLEQAVRLKPGLPRLANNLELARAAFADDLPRRRAGETDTEWASRLNDAGVAAQSRGEKARAIAAFSRAIEARGVWYERAANNLRIAQAAE